MGPFKQDFRFALRTLTRSPLFTTVAVLSLALGIGVNTALFSFVDRLLIRSLPIRDAEAVTLLDSPGPRSGRVTGNQTFNYPGYVEIRDGNDVFSGVMARFQTGVSLSWKNTAQLATAEVVTGNYFDVLGSTPHLGRLISPSDDVTPGAHPVVVLQHGYWTRVFGGDPSVVGKKVVINGQAYDIIGVAPPRFEGVSIGDIADVFVPMMMKAQITPTWDGLKDRRMWFLNVFARLKPGIRAEQAQARLEPLYARILNNDLQVLPMRNEQSRKRYLAKKLLVNPGYQGRSDIRSRIGKPALVLMCMVGLVLLIACANLANLLLARAAGRQREIAIRLSLGASRWHLMRQLFTESTIIALAGGAAGVLVAVWVGDLLASFAPIGQNASLDWSTPDARVLAFNFGVSVLTSVLFGLVPAWKATRPAVADTLKDQAGSVSSSLGDVRLRKGLVVAQISLSLLLIIGASLFARSLYNIRSLDPGFNADRLLTFSVDPTLSGYHKQKAIDIYEQVRTNVTRLPGVRSVALIDNAMLANNVAMATISIEGYTPRDDEDMNPDIASVSPGFFGAMGIRLLAGREFTDADRPGTQPVAIINYALAERYFPKQNPIGRRIGVGRGKPDMAIIGIVNGVKSRGMKDQNRPQYYLPYLNDSNPGQFTYYVRASGDPLALSASIRKEVQRVASSVPIFELRSMENQMDLSLSIERAVATMSTFFGLLATVLAAIGLYGVMAYTVTRRTREIGIRVALGAERTGVLWLVLREVAIMTGIGIAIGLPCAIALSRFVQAQLFGIRPNDPWTYAIAITAMVVIAMLAGFIPANRASRVNPIRALRYE